LIFFFAADAAAVLFEVTAFAARYFRQIIDALFRFHYHFFFPLSLSLLLDFAAACFASFRHAADAAGCIRRRITPILFFSAIFYAA